MKRFALLAFVVATISACGSSPLAPTPPPPANLTSTGNLTVTGCLGPSTTNLFTCGFYAGLATNSGSGCATSIRGTTVTYDATTRQQVGSSGWSYGATVRPGEQISYAGVSLIVTGPLSGGWYYTTTVAWDNVKCP